MRRGTADPCELVHHNKSSIKKLVLPQVGDTLGLGTLVFLQQEETTSKKFRSQPRVAISRTATTVSGLSITLKGRTFYITQTEKITKLKSTAAEKEFSRQRALAQYIEVNVRPDLCVPIELISPGKTPTTAAEFKALTKSIVFPIKPRRKVCTLFH